MNSLVISICWFLNIFLLSYYVITFWLLLPYSSDTYFILNLANHIFDKNNVDIARQFQFHDPWQNASFPPLYPLLVQGISFLPYIKEQAPLVINIGCALSNILQQIHLSKFLFKTSLPGLLTSLILLTNSFYIETIFSGHTMPLALCLILVLTILLLKYFQAQPKTKHLLLLPIGIVAGLSTLLRFDFLLSGLALGIILILTFKINFKQRLKGALIYFATYFIILLPWIIYSKHYFSLWWVTDNARTALLVNKSYVTDFLPQWHLNYQSVFSNPTNWLYKYLDNIASLLMILVKKIIFFKYNLLLLISFLLVLPLLNKDVQDTQKLQKKYSQWFQTQSILVVLLLINFLCIATSGYFQAKYLLNINLLYILSTAFSIYIVFNNIKKRRLYPFLILIIIIIGIICLKPSTIITKSRNSLLKRSQQHLSKSDIQALVFSIKDKNSLILFLLESSSYAAHYSYTTNNKSILTPYNLNGNNLYEFLQYIQPTHILYESNSPANKYSNLIEILEHDNMTMGSRTPIGDSYILGTINAKNL